MRIRFRDLAVIAGVAVGAAAAAAPAPASGLPRRSVADLVDELRDADAHGADLVDAAISTVCAAFPEHSVWHLWESPRTALANGRGWSQQYNTVLAEVLEALGFDVRLVHAARVQGWRNPWFFVSHTWVKVNIDGSWLDACASTSSNQLGQVGFFPVSDELPVRASTRFTVAAALVPFVTFAVWRAKVTGEPIPSWVHRRRETGPSPR